jgi:hypothetical protein
MRSFRAVGVLPLALGLALACAGTPEPPPAGMAQAWGELRLVPPAGVTPGGSGDSSYGDRRLRDVEFVDYSQPGFAVIYVEEEEPPAGSVELVIRASKVGTRLTPAHAAVGSAGRLSVRNDSGEPHVVSYPAAGLIRRLQPGETLESALPRAGEQGLFLLDLPDSAATVFAAPGRYAVVSAAGRFTLTGLAPGRRVLRVWHPRFPPLARPLDLAPDSSVRVDFELGTGRPGHAHAH